MLRPRSHHSQPAARAASAPTPPETTARAGARRDGTAGTPDAAGTGDGSTRTGAVKRGKVVG
ncbi:hypothetical protein, partial [Mycolicibacillus koreensis]|uniref:hypothetical protein n=1 Tax=Mycolicibacillus koreensis TaxID=1069220 RepID=UPI001A99FC43